MGNEVLVLDMGHGAVLKAARRESRRRREGHGPWVMGRGVGVDEAHDRERMIDSSSSAAIGNRSTSLYVATCRLYLYIQGSQGANLAKPTSYGTKRAASMARQARDLVHWGSNRGPQADSRCRARARGRGRRSRWVDVVKAVSKH
jgi:hypothetical protein